MASESLNRVIALRCIGLTLQQVQQVQQVLDEKVTPEALRAMLQLQHAELEVAMAAAAARLVQVEARLRYIENEGRMPMNGVVIKSIPAIGGGADCDRREFRSRGHRPSHRAALRRRGPAHGRHFPGAPPAAVGQAATIVHRGPMDTVLPTAQTLTVRVDENG